MTIICGACGFSMDKKEVMRCTASKCNKVYDIDCLGLKQEDFELFTEDQKQQWVCPECVCSKPVRINSGTPVRGTPEERKLYPNSTNVNTQRGSRLKKIKSPVKDVRDTLLMEFGELRSELIQRLDTQAKLIKDIYQVCRDTKQQLLDVKGVLQDNIGATKVLETQLNKLEASSQELEVFLKEKSCIQSTINVCNGSVQSNTYATALQKQKALMGASKQATPDTPRSEWRKVQAR